MFTEKDVQLKELCEEYSRERTATLKYILRNGKDNVSIVLEKYLDNLDNEITNLNYELKNQKETLSLSNTEPIKPHCKNTKCNLNKDFNCLEQVFLNEDGLCEYLVATEPQKSEASKQLDAIHKDMASGSWADQQDHNYEARGN
jgi:hypothetical protein